MEGGDRENNRDTVLTGKGELLPYHMVRTVVSGRYRIQEQYALVKPLDIAIFMIPCIDS